MWDRGGALLFGNVDIPVAPLECFQSVQSELEWLSDLNCVKIEVKTRGVQPLVEVIALNSALGGIAKGWPCNHSVQPATENFGASPWRMCYGPGSSLQVNTTYLAQFLSPWTNL